jgi:hypothetical protein
MVAGLMGYRRPLRGRLPPNGCHAGSSAVFYDRVNSKEKTMATAVRKLILLVPVAAMLLLGSCMTVNKLDSYDLYGSRLAVVMRTPPAPRMNVDYDVFIDSHNPIYSALSVLTNIAKANQAYHAETVMRDALDVADVPAIIRERAFSACAAALDVEPVRARAEADYILELDIREWGIDARSAWDPVSLRIQVSARLYRSYSDEMIWRRELTVKQSASPEMFGVGHVVNNMVTTAVLSEMTRDELETGFRELAATAAARVARSLEKDLDASRHSSYRSSDGWN